MAATPTILVVDDTADGRRLICDILKRELPDATVFAASNGPEALSRAQAAPPDIVLLDANMPGMDGFEVCRQLKSAPPTGHVPILMVSGVLVDGKHRHRGMDSGADGYLCKPFESEELITQIRALLRIGRSEAALRDIADRHRAEEELRNHREHLEDLVQERTHEMCQAVEAMRRETQEHQRTEEQRAAAITQSPIATIVVGEDDRIVSYNNATRELTGYSADEVSTATEWGDRVFPDDDARRQLAAQVQDARGGHDLKHAPPLSFTRKDGEQRLLRFHVSCFSGGYVAQMLDVTDRQRVLEALAKSRESFHSIVEKNSDGILVVCREGIVQFANSTARRLLAGVTNTATGGTFGYDLSLGGSEEIAISLGPGKRGIGELQAIETQWEGAPAYRVSIHDITARKQAEEALRLSEQSLSKGQEIASFGSWEWTAETARTIWSDEMYRLFGWEPGEVQVSGDTYLDHVLPEDRDKAREVVERAETDGAPYESEHRIVRKDGTVRTHHCRGEVFRDADGRLKRVLSTVQDITERRKAEEERRQLEQRIQQTQKLESLGVLAGGIAHDFNNLLMGILGNVELALDDISPVSPAIRSMKSIETAAKRASDLCRQMLAYSGRGKFVVETLDLNELMTEMGALIERSVSKKAVLTYDLADNLPAVEADATQIRQIALNLIINAAEAVGEASGFINVSTGAVERTAEQLRETWLREDLRAGLYVYLEVTDTGSGMEEQELKRIFDPFYTTKFTGRGLGLAAVLGIVRGHKGAIDIRSEAGKGTTFRVLLPASDLPALPLSQEPVSGIAEWRGVGTVLLVDDEESIRTVSKRMLEKWGFSVLLAADGREAVELFREHATDVVCVLLDLTMPNMDGKEAYQELRNIRRDVPVILSSGYNEQDVIGMFSGEELAGFVHKPYRSATLAAKIRQVLEP